MSSMKIAVVFLLAFLVDFGFPANAVTSASDRIVVEVRVKTELAKDLAQPVSAYDAVSGRQCLDGRPVKDFQGEIIAYWINMECPYCGIAEPLKAQRDNPEICIVARHIPSSQYGESLKKAISYEALRSFSVNAANRFWDASTPKTSLGIPTPYEAVLRSSMDEALISPDNFGKAVEEAATVVSADIVAAQGRISTTPTYEIQGIRFPACDFKAHELPKALELAKKARADEKAARLEIIRIITRGLLDENLL